MKIKNVSLVVLLGMLLTACTAQTPQANTIPSEVFTVVAQTLTAQYTPVTATATPKPATATPTPTLAATPTLTTAQAATASAPTAAGKPCDNAVFTNDVTIPDGTVLSPNQTFTKIWAIKNTGTCDWDTNFALKFYSGDKMDGHRAEMGTVIVSGDTTTISVQMTAPSTAGKYSGYWRMVNSANLYFGEMVSVNIVVQ